MAVTTPDRTPPETLLRKTTAVETPGVATNGTATAANAQTFTGTSHLRIPAALDSRVAADLPWWTFALAADIYQEWLREQAR